MVLVVRMCGLEWEDLRFREVSTMEGVSCFSGMDGIVSVFTGSG